MSRDCYVWKETSASCRRYQIQFPRQSTTGILAAIPGGYCTLRKYIVVYHLQVMYSISQTVCIGNAYTHAYCKNVTLVWIILLSCWKSSAYPPINKVKASRCEMTGDRRPVVMSAITWYCMCCVNTLQFMLEILLTMRSSHVCPSSTRLIDTEYFVSTSTWQGLSSSILMIRTTHTQTAYTHTARSLRLSCLNSSGSPGEPSGDASAQVILFTTLMFTLKWFSLLAFVPNSSLDASWRRQVDSVPAIAITDVRL